MNGMAVAKRKNLNKSVGKLPEGAWEFDMKKLIARSKKIRELEKNESEYKYDES